MSIAFPRDVRSGSRIDYLIYRCGGSDGIAVKKRTVFPIKRAARYRVASPFEFALNLTPAIGALQ